jgi:hypothetical protein
MLLGATGEYIRNTEKSPVFLKCSKLTDKLMMHSKSTCLSISRRITSSRYGCAHTVLVRLHQVLWIGERQSDGDGPGSDSTRLTSSWMAKSRDGIVYPTRGYSHHGSD